MDALLDRIVLRGRAESIPTHRVKDLETLKPSVPRPAIRKDIAAPMSDVKPGPGRVGEHIQTVVFRSWILVARFVQVVVNPVLTPLRLNLSRVVCFLRHLMIIAYRKPGNGDVASTNTLGGLSATARQSRGG